MMTIYNSAIDTVNTVATGSLSDNASTSTYTACHYGGERPWFLCTSCNRRAAVLCCNGPLFLCRHCYQLPYRSQQQGKMNRLIEQKHKLGERIFEHYEHGEGWGKKKGMHWTTFHRLHARYEALEQQWIKGIAAHLNLL